MGEYRVRVRVGTKYIMHTRTGIYGAKRANQTRLQRSPAVPACACACNHTRGPLKVILTLAFLIRIVAVLLREYEGGREVYDPLQGQKETCNTPDEGRTVPADCLSPVAGVWCLAGRQNALTTSHACRPCCGGVAFFGHWLYPVGSETFGYYYMTQFFGVYTRGPFSESASFSVFFHRK